MAKHRRPPSQSWKTFLGNHLCVTASIDLFVVPAATFKLLYGMVILHHKRRSLVSFGVTSNPTAEWMARQIADAFPWEEAPRYLLRDRDRIYGEIFVRRLRAMGIRDHPTAPRSPWQNPYVEWLIGSIRRECLDHIIVAGEAHLRSILKSYARYYNEARTHLSPGKDAPNYRPIQRFGQIVAVSALGGLDHRYCRMKFSAATGLTRRRRTAPSAQAADMWRQFGPSE